MNCEQVEESLSAYLDRMLAPDESRAVTLHVRVCPRCTSTLAEFRQNDVLVAQLPRVQPSTTLHERLFATPEIRELAALFTHQLSIAAEPTQPLELLLQQTPESLGRLQETPLPEVYVSQAPETEKPPSAPLPTPLPATAGKRLERNLFTPMKMAVVVALIAALCTASLFSLSLRRQSLRASGSGANTPLTTGQPTGQVLPLAAGMRFVFLRAGSLWSVLVDGSKRQPERLTSPNVTVAAGWVVSPALTGHAAGDVLAYIDTRGATLHTLRSDGQQDTVLPQVLLKTGINLSTAWAGPTGEAILSSLAWSNDGSLLAFLADPTGDDQAHLYLYSSASGKVWQVAPELTGSISHAVWSPDDTRLAFALERDGVVSVLDYNVQSQQTLDLSSLAKARGNRTDSLQTLGWSPSLSEPAVTWSLGSIGRISSLWIHGVGAGGTPYPQQLASGNFLQALYSPRGANGAGGWLLVVTVAGRAGDIWRMDLTPGARLVPLSHGRQVSFASWSPDGFTIFYLDGQNNGIGSGHLIHTTSGTDTLLSASVAVRPAPTWSTDNQQLAYSDGSQIAIFNIFNGSQLVQLHLRGQASCLTWLPTVPYQLIVSLSDTTPGIYLADILHNTSLQLDRLSTDDQVQWTAIP